MQVLKEKELNALREKTASDELTTFKAEYASQKAELESLAAFKEAMDAEGAGKNPYARARALLLVPQLKRLSE